MAKRKRDDDYDNELDKALAFDVCDGEIYMNVDCGYSEVKKWLDRGANANVIVKENHWNYFGSNDRPKNMTALHWACYCSPFLEVPKLLVEHGAKINATTPDGCTPLHLASNEGYTEIVEFLVNNGADVNATDSNGVAPLQKFLRGNAYGDWKLSTAKFLVENGAHVNSKDNNGDTPLHGAHEVEVASMLIENGADLNARNDNGKTPLYCLCAWGYKNEDAVRFLLSQGADVTLGSTDGITPLQVACQNNNRDIVWILVRHCPWLVSE